MIKNAVIIGAGSIGALKPNEYDSPEGKNILTIAHAMYNNKDINLNFIVDKDASKAMDAAEKWNCNWSKVITTNKCFDIAAVCTPTNTHHEVMKELLSLSNPPKLIIAEKPFCDTLAQAKEIVDECKKRNIPLMIDYIRRYDPVHRGLRSIFKKEKVHHAKLTYTRGLKHEACHAIDLFLLWFGEFKSMNMICSSRINDRDVHDPVIGAVAVFENCNFVSFNPVDGRDYAVFDIEVFTNKGKYLLTEHGKKLFIYRTIPDSYGNYHCLTPWPTEVKETKLTEALSYLVAEAVVNLTISAEPSCSGDDAAEVHKIYKYLEENI